MPKVVGITGGIATGKSTVLGMLADLGARTLSADDLAREVLAKGTPGYAETVERFGQAILAPDGQIDRRALAGIVFADAEARQTLNDITHPRIIAAMRRRIDSFRAHPPDPNAVLAVEIPLLVECGLAGTVDEVLVVVAEPRTQVSRLTRRYGMTDEDARRRLAAQMPMECKIERADRVITNEGSSEDLADSVRAVWDQIHLL
jgi:dephospho-CoA kinase